MARRSQPGSPGSRSCLIRRLQRPIPGVQHRACRHHRVVLGGRCVDLGVHEGRVVVLGVVLEQHLPVERPVVALGQDGLQIFDREQLDRRSEWPEIERSGVATAEIDEDTASPLADQHRGERMVGQPKPLGFADPGGAGQRAIESVEPGVVRAADQGTVGGVEIVAQRRGAVSAHVEERAKRAPAIADEQQRNRADRGRRPRTRCRHVVDDACADPGAPEDAVDLEAEVIGGGVAGRRQGSRRADANRVWDVACHRGPFLPRAATATRRC
ncbi:MAG: hypothetical protein FD127_838 [Acidimicrobiaceae bacterium]|nr:MAG: hypothetical protein FD127_838 [Acidimicrobiaceae bacterium]